MNTGVETDEIIGDRPCVFRKRERLEIKRLSHQGPSPHEIEQSAGILCGRGVGQQRSRSRPAQRVDAERTVGSALAEADIQEVVAVRQEERGAMAAISSIERAVSTLLRQPDSEFTVATPSM